MLRINNKIRNVNKWRGEVRNVRCGAAAGAVSGHRRGPAELAARRRPRTSCSGQPSHFGAVADDDDDDARCCRLRMMLGTNMYSWHKVCSAKVCTMCAEA
jgi:hypothetical protein